MSKLDLGPFAMEQSSYWTHPGKVKDGTKRGGWEDVAYVPNDRTSGDLFFTFELGSPTPINGIMVYPCDNLGGWFNNCQLHGGSIEVCGSDSASNRCANSLAHFLYQTDWYTADGGDCPATPFKGGQWLGRKKDSGSLQLCGAGAAGPCARCDKLFYESYGTSYYDDPVTFASTAASSTLQGYPQAKTMATTTNGYRFYTIYYRQGSGLPSAASCGNGWGAHKCMAEIELYTA